MNTTRTRSLLTTIALAIGVSVLSLPAGLAVYAAETPSPSREGSLPEQSSPATETNQLPVAPAKQVISPERSVNPNAGDGTRVNVTDVYPKYCRSLFPPTGSVELYEYQQTMQRCIYSPGT